MPENMHVLELEGAEFKNTSGLGLRVLVDMQKLVVCGMLDPHESSAPEHFHPEQKQEVKVAMSASAVFSAKVNLIFRSDAVLRRGGDG